MKTLRQDNAVIILNTVYKIEAASNALREPEKILNTSEASGIIEYWKIMVHVFGTVGVWNC
jgi:hypothetical protein